jgi:uncharacterized protein (TIGR02246 family)
MNWKPIAVTAVLAAAFVPVVSQSKQPARTEQKKPAAKVAKNADAPAKDADPHAKELAALQKSAQAFTEAFNKGDAKAVAALWTEDGEYIDESDQRFEGRDAIEKEYAKFFAAHPGAKIALTVDSLRLASDTTAIEDGRAVVELGPIRAGGYGKYTVVHVKSDDKWLMSSVRDARVGSSPAADQLQNLQWLIGSWSAEENGAKMEVACRWIANNNFLERNYSVKRSDQVVTSGLQIIGWNPQAERIQSWLFTSDGGHAVGLWNPRNEGWTIETVGTLADGTPTRAVNLVSRLDDDALSWKSVERSAGGVPLTDTDDVVLKRVAAKR